MGPFNALEWGYGSLHISQLHYGKGMLGSGCLIWIWKLCMNFFLKILPHGWQKPLLCLDVIIIIRPKILLILNKISTNKALKQLLSFCWGSDNFDVNDICFWTLCHIWYSQMVFQVCTTCDREGWHNIILQKQKY